MANTIKRTKLTTEPAAVAEAFAARVYQLLGVEGVYFWTDAGQTTHLWTVVGRDDLALRERIYRIEAQLYNRFPGARLDFFVLTRDRLEDGGQDYKLATGFSLVRKEAPLAAQRGA
ncbi:MAG: hypothetical protein HY681_09515 [Chloroflexi bacterium]|nr:hypothetical protein [Chloroflexota bacterium]